MKFFIDTANLSQIRDANDLGILNGAVTNLFELYECDGSVGAAIGAGLGANIFSNAKEAFINSKRLQYIEPTVTAEYNSLYLDWETLLHERISKL